MFGLDLTFELIFELSDLVLGIDDLLGEGFDFLFVPLDEKRFVGLVSLLVFFQYFNAVGVIVVGDIDQGNDAIELVCNFFRPQLQNGLSQFVQLNVQFQLAVLFLQPNLIERN